MNTHYKQKLIIGAERMKTLTLIQYGNGKLEITTQELKA